MLSDQFGKDQHEEEFIGYDDEDHPGDSEHLWTSSRFLKGKVANGFLGGSHVKSQKGKENKVNEAKANFYRGTQWTWVKVEIVSIWSASYSLKKDSDSGEVLQTSQIKHEHAQYLYIFVLDLWSL